MTVGLRVRKLGVGLLYGVMRGWGFGVEEILPHLDVLLIGAYPINSVKIKLLVLYLLKGGGGFKGFCGKRKG